MKKPNRNARKSDKKISIEKMDETQSKYYISSQRISAVTFDDNVQNYEDYINDKYLTGAIVNTKYWKKHKKQKKQVETGEVSTLGE